MSTEPENGQESAETESIEERIAKMTGEFVESLRGVHASELEAHVAEARAEAKQEAQAETARALAASASRIRAEDSVTGIATALVDGAAHFCGRAALFIHKGDQLLGFRIAGDENADRQSAFQRLSTTVSSAPSIEKAIRSLEPVVGPASAEALSDNVAELFGVGEDDEVHLLPIALRDKVLAVVYCDSKGPDGPVPVSTAAIEVLTSISEAWIEAVGTRRKQTAA